MPYHVYILRGDSGRHYIGLTNDLKVRLAQHQSGHTHTTKRLGGNVHIVADAEFKTRTEASAIEQKLKRWKNPAKALALLRSL